MSSSPSVSNTSLSKIMNKGSDLLGMFTSKSKNISNSYASIKNGTSSTGLIIIIIISVLAILAVAIYTYIKLKNTAFKSVAFIPTPIEVNKNVMEIIASQEKQPTFTNGKEYAYSTWLYVDSVNNISKHNLVFFKSPSSTLGDVNFKSADIVAYIEKNTNKLKIKLRTANADENNVGIDVTSKNKQGIDGKLSINQTNSNVSLHSDTCYYSDFTIDYLPLQRWVNITINVDNNLVSIFLDGDLLSTKNLSTVSDPTCTSGLSDIISNKPGNIFAGTSVKNNLETFNGYLSRFQVFNYSITIDHVKAIYKSGPLKKSILRTVGFPSYGVRNPLYKIDAVKASDSKQQAVI